MGTDDKEKKKKRGKEALPEHLAQQATHVVCGPARNYHVSQGLPNMASHGSSTHHNLYLNAQL